jgi:PAS domain S-box-containing protein
MNPAAERLLGCPAAQAFGDSLARFVPEPWRAAHGAHVAEFAAGRAPARVMAAGRRVDLRRADGRTVTVDIALSRVELAIDAGKPRVCYAAAMRDLSEARALEEQLMMLERRMRAVFELSPIAIWICEDHRLVYANHATARLLGVTDIAPLLGTPLESLVEPESQAALRREMERVLAGEPSAAPVPARVRQPDGATRDVEIAFAALPDHGSTTVQMVVNDVTERQREAATLERSRRALRELSASVVDAREEERRRIARELHDELGQRLTALKIDLANLSTAARLRADDPRVAAMSVMLDDTLASVRRIASDLRPLMLDDLGLNAAISWLASDASRRIGIPVHTRLPEHEPQVEQRVATALYRMVQEALTNVARHAQAREAWVELRAQGATLLLEVADDGAGVADASLQRPGSFGLMGMRERSRMLGGEFSIGPRPGGGTRVVVRLPLRGGSFVESR